VRLLACATRDTNVQQTSFKGTKKWEKSKDANTICIFRPVIQRLVAFPSRNVQLMWGQRSEVSCSTKHDKIDAERKMKINQKKDESKKRAVCKICSCSGTYLTQLYLHRLRKQLEICPILHVKYRGTREKMYRLLILYIRTKRLQGKKGTYKHDDWSS